MVSKSGQKFVPFKCMRCNREFQNEQGKLCEYAHPDHNGLCPYPNENNENNAQIQEKGLLMYLLGKNGDTL